MENEAPKKPETPEVGGDHTAEVTRQNLTNLALTLFQCKDGSLVRNPIDCKKPVGERTLPGLTIG